MAGLALQSISKSFGATQVLSDIALDIRGGEFLTLLGPSGCGKSTLLRIIAGLESADAGSVAIGGRSVDALPPKDRDVAMVFQTYALYPHLTAAQNIALPLRMRRMTRLQRAPIVGRFTPGAAKALAEIDAEVTAVAEALGLGALLARKPAQLSGGQRQRVALGRAMVRHPAVFLMDEPLSNLDAERRTAMRAEIAALHRRLGVTFVYVTHDQTEAMTLSDRIAVMDHGRIIQLGSPRTIYDSPASLKVAEFVGAPKINLAHARLQAGLLTADGRPVARPLGPVPDEVRIGFRPETVRLGPASGVALQMTVRSIEHLGGDAHVFGEALWSERKLAARCTAAVAASLAIDQPVGLSFAVDEALLFGADGARLPCSLAPCGPFDLDAQVQAL